MMTPQSPPTPTISPALIADRLARVCMNLRPFQTLEFDPATNTLYIMTESLIPSRAIDQLTKIISERRRDEKLTIRRFNDAYKISIVRQVKLSNSVY